LLATPPALQLPLLPCPDQIINNGHPTIITFEATSTKGNSSLLPPDAPRNSEDSCPKEIPNISTLIYPRQEVTPMAQL
jgi:hypothetical protein